MSEQRQVTQEELAQIKELQDAYLRVTYDLGQIGVEKYDLKQSLDKLRAAEEETLDHLAKLKERETELSTSLQEKYGSSTIDLETGVIK